MLKPIIPSGIIQNFKLYNKEALQSMKQTFGLFMSVSDLEFIQKQYCTPNHAELTTDELFIFDSVVKKAKGFAKNAVLKELLTSSDDIISSYNDLLSKNSLKNRRLGTPLTIDELASVISDYMERIGLFPRRNDTLPVSKESSKLDPETAIAILLPTVSSEASKRLSSVERLLNSEAGEKIIAERQISEFGIAHTLATMANGFFADFTVIKDYDTEQGISFLCDREYGEFLIAFNKQYLNELTEAANALSLTLTYFAKTTSASSLVQKTYPELTLNIDTQLITDLASLRMDGTFDMTDTEKIESVYKKAMISVADAILEQIGSGASRKDLCLFNSYVFPKDAQGERLGTSLAAILGVYRATIELCAAEEHMVIFTDTEDISLTSAALKNKECPDIPPRITEDGVKVYLLSFDQDESGLPNFKSLRAMWNYVETLLKAHRIKSSIAVNGDIEKSLRLLLGDLSLALTDDGKDLAARKLKGILIGTDGDIELGVPLGITEFAPTPDKNGV